MSLGSLVLELQGNVAKTQEDMGRLNQIVESAMTRINAVAMRTSKNISDVGAAAGSIKRVQGAEDAAKDIEKIGHASVGARREMLVLAHELATGNFKRAAGSAMVLGERLDIMSKIMSPTGIAVAVLAGAILGLAIAAVKGAEESKHFADSIAMTGGIAGQTEASYNAMARSIQQASGATIGSAREITQALIETGRFGPQSIGAVGLAATRLAQLSGKSAEDVVKDFARMSDGVEKWAVEANKQYHFLDGEILDHIHTLEQQGNKEQAEIVASQALYESWGGSAEKNLTGVAAMWDAVTHAVSEAGNAFKMIGRQETAAEQIAALKAQVALNRAHPETSMGIDGPHNPQDNTNADMQKLGYLNSLARRQDDNADLTATRKAHNDKVVEAKEYMQDLAKQYKVGEENLDSILKKIADDGKLAGTSPADIAAIQAKVRQSYAPKGAAGIQTADMNSQLKPLQDQISGEEKLLQYRDKVLEQYNRAHLISDQGFYDTSATVLQAYNTRIAALYDQEIAIVENAAAHAANAKQKTELMTKANGLRDDKQQALLESGERLASLTTQQTQAAQKYADEVQKLNTELGKLDHTQGQQAGAAFDREHEGLKAQATQNGDSGTLDTLSQARALTVAQSQINDLKKQAEDIDEALAIKEKRARRPPRNWTCCSKKCRQLRRIPACLKSRCRRNSSGYRSNSCSNRQTC
jgi:phage-related minor tail protein